MKKYLKRILNGRFDKVTHVHCADDSYYMTDHEGNIASYFNRDKKAPNVLRNTIAVPQFADIYIPKKYGSGFGENVPGCQKCNVEHYESSNHYDQEDAAYGGYSYKPDKKERHLKDAKCSC